jgi:hypothetical protein
MRDQLLYQGGPVLNSAAGGGGSTAYTKVANRTARPFGRLVGIVNGTKTFNINTAFNLG